MLDVLDRNLAREDVTEHCRVDVWQQMKNEIQAVIPGGLRPKPDDLQLIDLYEEWAFRSAWCMCKWRASVSVPYDIPPQQTPSSASPPPSGFPMEGPFHFLPSQVFIKPLVPDLSAWMMLLLLLSHKNNCQYDAHRFPLSSAFLIFRISPMLICEG